MSAPKFTPGPWNWSGAPGASTLEGAKPNAYVISQADYEGMWFSRYNEEDEANASLIAAAPELYAALDELVSATESIGQHLVYNAPTLDVRLALDAARAALSKANPVHP